VAGPPKATNPKTAKKKRVRRSPDDARALLLEACKRLLVTVGPHGVGLVDVAREAGVSHALVTHYYGTIDALIDAALEDFAETQRRELTELILERPDASPRDWMRHWFASRNRPEVARLLAWSFLTGRVSRKDFFAKRHRGAKRIADAVEARLAGSGVSREDVEFAILLVISATHGYALGKSGYWPSLGHDDPGDAEDQLFFDRLADLVEVGLVRRARPAT
jgi:AcrR family transcriptional regulator